MSFTARCRTSIVIINDVRLVVNAAGISLSLKSSRTSVINRIYLIIELMAFVEIAKVISVHSWCDFGIFRSQ